MPRGFQGRVLKSGLARTVYVSRAGDVVKRFHNPSAVQALRDRRRAVAEQRVLEALLAQRLAVPRPLEVRRVRGAWEVVMERIEDAVPLGEVVRGRAPAPADLEVLAAAVGELVARAHAAGLDHPDLHPGNVLVDRGGRPWLIDFHKARMRPRLAPAVVERDLVSLTAYLRETLPAAARAALLDAWHRAQPKSTRGEAEALRRTIEQRARLHRRAWVAHAQGRWTRSSSRCEVLDTPAGPLFLRRGLPLSLAQALGAAGVQATSLPELRTAEVLVLERRPAHELRERWFAAARLTDHGLGALRPLAAGPGWTAFEVPAGARPIALADSDGAALGRLVGGLHDRGLDLNAPPELWSDGRELYLAPPAGLRHVDPRPGAMDPARRCAHAAALGARGQGEFRRAYAGAFRSGPTEVEALTRELADGPA